MYNKKKQRRILAVAFTWFLFLIGSFMLVRQLTEEKSYFLYTIEDVKMLGNFMQAEMTYAKEYCSLENQEPEDIKNAYMLTGSVVLHRLESRLWGETMEQVIYAPYQYPVTMMVDIMSDIDTPPEVYRWAEELLRYGPKGPEGLIYEWWFKIGDDEPYWELGGMCFYESDIVTKMIEDKKLN